MLIPIEYQYNGYKNSYIRMDYSPSHQIAIYSTRGEKIREVKDGYELEQTLKDLRKGAIH